MKVLVALLILSPVAAFVSLTAAGTQTGSLLKMGGYVPDGMSPEQYRKLREKEKAEASKKRFGAFGPQSFKSRSLQSFQQDLEKGKSGHLMPVFNAKEKIKKGLLKPEDIPYMQRGGAWDNSDVKTAKKKEWNELDKRYNQNWSPANLDWTMGQARSGPKAAAASKKKNDDEPPKKKLFGLF